MKTGARMVVVVVVAIACNALDRAGWRWPGRRLDAWLNGGGLR